MLQGPLLCALLQSCSSSSCAVQLLALTGLLSLAAMPDNLPAFAKVGPICNEVGLSDFISALVCQVHTRMAGCLCTFTAAAAAQQNFTQLSADQRFSISIYILWFVQGIHLV